jgi:hypothetical protein
VRRLRKIRDLSPCHPLTANQVVQHKYERKRKQLSQDRWNKFSFYEQMANVGSEVERAIIWREKDKDYAKKALERQLELLDLTVADQKNRLHLKELIELREALVNYFTLENQQGLSDKILRDFFYAFNLMARKNT